jgi:hypothetical protein
MNRLPSDMFILVKEGTDEIANYRRRRVDA